MHFSHVTLQSILICVVLTAFRARVALLLCYFAPLHISCHGGVGIFNTVVFGDFMFFKSLLLFLMARQVGLKIVNPTKQLRTKTAVPVASLVEFFDCFSG